MTDSLFWARALETVSSSRMLAAQAHLQHGQTSVFSHSIAVAYYSFRLARFLEKRLSFRFSTEELIRGALLHDYFLYDWHDGVPRRRLHGLYHPLRAHENAQLDFALSEREADIILKHMFPLTATPPHYRESVVVCLVDKVCALYEMMRAHPYQNLLWRASLVSAT